MAVTQSEKVRVHDGRNTSVLLVESFTRSLVVARKSLYKYAFLSFLSIDRLID